jgi:hypothetical protein
MSNEGIIGAENQRRDSGLELLLMLEQIEIHMW